MVESKTDRVGQQFGEYSLTQFLGRGSFGDVYLGKHINDASVAAVKVLHIQLTDRNDVKSFINEARTIRLAHPNIIRVLDFGIGEDDLPFIVMDYASNGTLRHRHPRHTRVPLTTVVEYVKQIADALHYAHEHRLIHRDVKPRNILVNSHKSILLSDFGIATVAHSTHSATTQDKAGTIPYMAPEQIQGKPVPASDQYALGIMTYEWLCGECPFQGDAIEIAVQHYTAPIPSLCEKVPDLSPEVEQVIAKALAKSPKDRFVNVIAFANALEEASRVKSSIGTTLLVYANHKDEVRTVAWSPNGLYIASGSADGIAQVWRPTWSNRQTAFIEATTIYEGHTNSISALTWSPDSQWLASASLDQTVQIWNATTGNVLFPYLKHPSWVRTVAWPFDGRYLASGTFDGSVQLWDAATGELLSTHCSHIDEIRGLAWSPDGHSIASGSADKTAHIWDIRAQETILIYTGHSKSVNTVSWSPDGQFVASGSLDGTVQVWHVHTGENLMTYFGHSAGVNTLAWSPNGRYIASGARDGLVHMWDAFTGEHLHTYTSHTHWLMSLSWSPDGDYIASASADKTVHIWQVRL
ncbi:hypothetical protein KSC_023700 [Ktedonobacter sp. SOSP1-52]|uniref:WD40 repeat domain-containing serine/threonine protein kinase n=1 Tax=Ktedonobacter sp. SOSP1-52 TaxID=2778366 RepID=UPI0019155DEA|nr:serine/threonine-protein kinase [Ktedonobacter sp. SOSP1-52]GHO63478.1 hypothetical protein KSC_023700 [Ktedonobacter sp. SOSP1-52]